MFSFLKLLKPCSHQSDLPGPTKMKWKLMTLEAFETLPEEEKKRSDEKGNIFVEKQPETWGFHSNWQLQKTFYSFPKEANRLVTRLQYTLLLKHQRVSL